VNSRTAESFAEARREIEEVSRLLLDPTPGVLEACRIHLSNAARLLEDSRANWPGELARPQIAGEAQVVRRAFLHARRLLKKAAKFHIGWQRILAGAVSGEYRADGLLPDMPCPRQIYLQG
jgi:hypothetical protein